MAELVRRRKRRRRRRPRAGGGALLLLLVAAATEAGAVAAAAFSPSIRPVSLAPVAVGRRCRAAAQDRDRFSAFGLGVQPLLSQTTDEDSVSVDSSSSSAPPDESDGGDGKGEGAGDSSGAVVVGRTSSSARERIRSVPGKVKDKVKGLAKSIISAKKSPPVPLPPLPPLPHLPPLPLSAADAKAAVEAVESVVPDPRNIAELVKDAAFGTAELAAEEVRDVIGPAVGEFVGGASRRIHRGRAFAGSSSANGDGDDDDDVDDDDDDGGLVTTMADTRSIERSAALEGDAASAIDAVALARTTAADAFAAAEAAVDEAERALRGAREALVEAKAEASEAMACAEEAAAAASDVARKATELATETAAARITTAAAAAKEATTKKKARRRKAEGAAVAVVAAPEETAVIAPASSAAAAAKGKSGADVRDVSGLTYDDVDYHLSEMAPPFIGEDQCLVPGEAVVRVEKAPDNSRRIFAGIDIMASVDDVWKVLTDYENLQKVVPNLVVNEVLETYGSSSSSATLDENEKEEDQCRSISLNMKGARLRQIGGAKVVGINFSARTTLEVREWPQGMPDFAHYYTDEIYEGKTRTRRAREGRGRPLRRYRFPRPFALSSLPTKDISMQSVEDDDGEFRMYQGVWRMQPLPGCAPEGEHAMRLTYAVEISPRPYLPVALVEGRIAQDLCVNLKAIREHVSR